MKLCNTNNIEIVKACQECFSFELPNEQLAKRVVKFESKVKRVLQFNDAVRHIVYRLLYNVTNCNLVKH